MFREIYDSQKKYFREGSTLSKDSRIRALKSLHDMVEREQDRIIEALGEDLGKSPQEAYVTEVLPVLSEASLAVGKLPGWMKEERKKGTLLSPLSSYGIVPEPKGQVLIVAPFNYPFQLALIPLVSALAAGNTVIMKVSEISEKTGRLLVELINGTFDDKLVYCTDVDPGGFEDLLDLPYNHYFFTGSTRIGREIAGLAADNLASCTLELGGKSPAIVHKSASLREAARKIVWGKFLNVGQTCIAPDYVLVDEKVEEEFINCLKEEIKGQYGDALTDSTYPNIVSERHFSRLLGMLEEEECICGGGADRLLLKMEPTLVLSPKRESRLMREEIFGPILPIVSYGDEEEMIKIVNRNPDPLALYVFTRDRSFEKMVLSRIPSGGCCVNDVLVHLLSHDVPFGGRGTSGHGSYHGKRGFLCFSHEKTVCRTPWWMDFALRYRRGEIHPLLTNPFITAILRVEKGIMKEVFFMTKNQSNVERLIRSIVGLILLILTGFVSGALQVILGIIGAVLLATGLLGFCPLYKVLKINTREKKD